MKFPFWTSGFKRKTEEAAVSPGFAASTAATSVVPRSPQRAVVLTPLAANPVVREMEQLLARAVYRVGETMAKSEIYFPASDLAVLGISCDAKQLIELADHKARQLLLRPEIRRGERFAAYTGELAAAMVTAERAAVIFRLLAADPANATALTVLRRVTDACDKVFFHSAKLLEAEPSEAFKWANSVLVAQGEAQTALNKAMIMLARRPAILAPHTEKMTRAAAMATIIAANTCAHAAMECRETILPNSPGFGVAHA